MATIQVFLSHSSADRDVAEQVVTALRGAGADVWFDEHNLGATQLLEEIQRQLSARPVFVVLLSKAAFASDWVKRECKWAFNIQMRDPSHIILPIVVSPIEPAAFNTMLFLEDYKRIEQRDHTPYPLDEMMAQALRLLALTPAGAAPAPVTPQPTESVEDLLTQGRALAAQKRWGEALPFFQRAAERDASNAIAWGGLGWMLNELKRNAEALNADDRSLALNDQQAWVWNNKGNALSVLKRPEEALVAYDRALALDPTDVFAWTNKGATLGNLKRNAEALVALDQALALDPTDAVGWYNKGVTLGNLKRNAEALVAFDQALALDFTLVFAWTNKGAALFDLKRYDEALVAIERALALDPTFADAWYNKAITLRALGRIAEAEAAERRAKELGG